MKKSIRIILCLLFAIVFLGLPLGKIQGLNTDALYKDKKMPFNFPASLQVVGDWAFANTGIDAAVFSDELMYIGKFAFCNASEFHNVYIPPKTMFIGTDAFPGGTVVHGVENSYVGEWACKNGYLFVDDDIWSKVVFKAKLCLEQIFSFSFTTCLLNKTNVLSLLNRKRKFVKSMRPKDRPELWPINYRFP